MNDRIEHLRREYSYKTLNKNEVSKDPIEQFRLWFQEALDCNCIDANAMTLSTVNKNCRPSSRIVLIKDIDEDGFTFYTDYSSKKGAELEENPFASLNFYWSELSRQVKIEGKVEKVPAEESENYFNSRPEDSRISAIISDQSSEVPDRKFLEKKWNETLKKVEEGKPLKRPSNWGGYKLKPDLIEFWQGRESRLHDRIQYKLENGEWKISRLAP
jgi:pyridoxamine 5'-phosphate oxidase